MHAARPQPGRADDARAARPRRPLGPRSRPRAAVRRRIRHPAWCPASHDHAAGMRWHRSTDRGRRLATRSSVSARPARPRLPTAAPATASVNYARRWRPSRRRPRPRAAESHEHQQQADGPGQLAARRIDEQDRADGREREHAGGMSAGQDLPDRLSDVGLEHVLGEDQSRRARPRPPGPLRSSGGLATARQDQRQGHQRHRVQRADIGQPVRAARGTGSGRPDLRVERRSSHPGSPRPKVRTPRTAVTATQAASSVAAAGEAARAAAAETPVRARTAARPATASGHRSGRRARP